MNNWWRRPGWSGIGIFVVAIAVRIALSFAGQTWNQLRDGYEMTRAARSIAQTGDMRDIFSKDGGPSSHLAPLYPWFRGALIACLSEGPPYGEGSRAERFVMMASATGLTCLAFALLPLLATWLQLRSEAGTLAGFLLALYPFHLRMETFGTWEQAHAAFALIGVLLLVVHLHRTAWRSTRWVLAAGFLFGLAGLLNPSILMTGMLLVVACLLTAGEAPWGRIIRSGAIIAGVATLVITPWIIRNYVELGGFVPLRSNLGLELYVGNNDDANGTTFGTVPDDTRESQMARLHPYQNKAEQAHYREVGELRYVQEKQQLAQAWIREHPGQFLWLCGQRFRYYWFPIADMWPTWMRLRTWMAVCSWPVGLGCLLGLGWLFARRHPGRWLIAVAVLAPSLVYMVTHVDPRYRYPTWALSMLVACELLIEVLPSVPPIALGAVVRFKAMRGLVSNLLPHS